MNPAGSWLHLGDHPVAEALRQLGLPRKPLMAFSYPERAAVLPAGEVIETGVRPLRGYTGSERAGRLSVRYN